MQAWVTPFVATSGTSTANPLPWIAFHELLANVGLLFLLGFAYEIVHGFFHLENRLKDILLGLLAGGVGLLIMSTPFPLAPGIVYDTRSILVSVTALSFGPLPGLLAALITATARVLRGGAGIWAGLGTILTSFLIGLAWRRAVRKRKWTNRIGPVILMGVLVHLAMLACQLLLLPEGTGQEMVRTIWLPVMVIYPVGTVILSLLLLHQTDRHLDLRRVAEAEEKYRSLFADNTAPMLVVDPETGRLVDGNPAAAAYYGYPLPDLLTMRVQDLNLLSPEEIREELKAARDMHRNHFLFRHRLSTGEIRHVEIYSGPVTIDGQRRLHSIIHDVTARVEAEQRLADTQKALQDARDKAEEASKAKSRFLASMSHEIRTPMNGIVGFLQLLGESPLNEEQRRYLAYIRSSSDMLLSVINSILDFSKADAERLVFEHAPFSLPEAIRQSVLAFTPKAEEKALDLTLQLPDRFPGTVYGDALRLRQILTNLTSNAIKFTERGWVHVTAKVMGETTETWNIRFSVTDTGIGISPEQQRLLFEPFTQADPTITRKYGGTGLGLALSKRLARYMGGDMGVDSALGEGATFWFTLPLGKTDTRPTPTEP